MICFAALSDDFLFFFVSRSFETSDSSEECCSELSSEPFFYSSSTFFFSAAAFFEDLACFTFDFLTSVLDFLITLLWVPFTGVAAGSFLSLMIVLIADFELAIGEDLSVLFLLTGAVVTFYFSGVFSTCCGFGFS